jgi:hypothetical protein
MKLCNKGPSQNFTKLDIDKNISDMLSKKPHKIKDNRYIDKKY